MLIITSVLSERLSLPERREKNLRFYVSPVFLRDRKEEPEKKEPVSFGVRRDRSRSCQSCPNERGWKKTVNYSDAGRAREGRGGGEG